MTKPSRLLGEQTCRGAVAVRGVASAALQGTAPVGPLGCGYCKDKGSFIHFSAQNNCALGSCGFVRTLFL